MKNGLENPVSIVEKPLFAFVSFCFFSIQVFSKRLKNLVSFSVEPLGCSLAKGSPHGRCPSPIRECAICMSLRALRPIPESARWTRPQPRRRAPRAEAHALQEATTSHHNASERSSSSPWNRGAPSTLENTEWASAPCPGVIRTMDL